MNDNVRHGIRRVAEGESVNDVLHALVSEARMGDPDELERLYGGDFDSRGHLDFGAKTDTELDNVPAFVRKNLAHHGYQHFRSDEDTHIYTHPLGHTVHINTDGTNFRWTHAHNGVQSHPQARGPQSAADLTKHLDRIHS